MKLDFSTYRVLNGLRTVGNMSAESMGKIITNNRINTLKKEGYISRVSYQDNHVSTSRSQYTYRLTNKGKEYCREEAHMKNFAAGRNMERHNTRLGEEYANLTAEEQITCMNEMDLKEYLYEHAQQIKEVDEDRYQEYLDKMEQMSLVDMTYQTTEGELVCVEVITSNYSQETIEQKEITAELVACQSYEVININ